MILSPAHKDSQRPQIGWNLELVYLNYKVLSSIFYVRGLRHSTPSATGLSAELLTHRMCGA